MHLPPKQQKFSISQRLKSFGYAWAGLKHLLRHEHNARIHTMAAVAAVGASFYFKLDSWEWLVIVFSIALVFMAELINTAIENLADYQCQHFDSRIKVVKDVSAAAVLVASGAAILAALIIFGPRLWSM